ncbi:hypothetical protein HHI36_010767 [Cryptolaemus montrouzieri]|uniref:AN1-type domain-containing protein n=1 Tax=Cryptolaemus montrouzieri TaxID=559131 RepID=A0ABD2MJS9_9CUCU
MELPHLGKQCSEPSCKKLDFLPIKCDACNEIFCGEHYQFKSHNCKNSYKKDNQVPVCPLCNKPIPLKYGESPDVVVGFHIDNDCQSDPARNRRKVFTNRCSFKGCKVKEVIPITCSDCKNNFCLKHRFQNDHKCTGKMTVRETILSKSVLLNPTQNQKIPQTSNASRNNFSGAVQENMSEDEALAMALSLSLNEAQNPQLSQEELDFALACQLQEEQNQQTAMVGGARPNRDRCNVS